MTVSHQEKYKRYRVYISLGHRDSIQKYFHYGSSVSSYKSEPAAKRAAHKAHKELVAIHRPVDKSHPFELPEKHRMGKKRRSPMPIRNISIALAPCKKGCMPDWTIDPRYKSFHTYPPYFNVMRFDYGEVGRRPVAQKSIRINSSRSYKSQCVDVIDAYIEIFPEYADYRDEMLKCMPTWKQFWGYIWDRAKERYDCFE